MASPLFDTAVLPLRTARAYRMGGEAFLHERAFDDCLERIAAARRCFQTCLIFGTASPGWSERLCAAGVGQVTVIEPGSTTPLPESPQLCISVGALDTTEPLPELLAALRFAMAPDALFIGALVGGDSLPALRAAMREADRAEGGAAVAHVHPRIDPPSFASLLANAGFLDAVVDVDRVTLRYAGLDELVRDLRGMAATNRLLARPRRPVLRRGRAAADAAFAALAENGKTSEIIEILHFAAWTSPT